MTLPDCMMPDGADPCRGYAELKAELAALHCPDDARCRDERVRKLEAECERLREALIGCIDLAEFWINHGEEPNMSRERYNLWLATGHHSKSMRAAIDAARKT